MTASDGPFSEEDLTKLKDQTKFQSGGAWHAVSLLVDELRKERKEVSYLTETNKAQKVALKKAHEREDHAKVSALPLEVLDSHVEYLISMGTREGLLIAQDLNDRFGRSARKRAGIND